MWTSSVLATGASPNPSRPRSTREREGPWEIPHAHRNPEIQHFQVHISEFNGVELDCASGDSSNNLTYKVLVRVPLLGQWVRSTYWGHGHFLSVLLLCDNVKGRQIAPRGTPHYAKDLLAPSCSTKTTHIPRHKIEPVKWTLTYPASETLLCTCLNRCLNLPNPLLHFRIWNPLTPISRTHCLPSTHLLRPQQPLCSGSYSVWLRGSMVGMGCAASLTSSSQPRGSYSTCSRKPVWVPALQGPKPMWDPLLREQNRVMVFPAEGNLEDPLLQIMPSCPWLYGRARPNCYLVPGKYLNQAHGILDLGKYTSDRGKGEHETKLAIKAEITQVSICCSLKVSCGINLRFS